MRSARRATATSRPPLGIELAVVRHPRERRVVLQSAVANLALIVVAVAVIVVAPEWLSEHPRAASLARRVQLAAVLGLLLLPAMGFLRLGKWMAVQLNSVRIGPEQLPELHAILERQCRVLGIEMPALYLSTLPGVGVSGALALGRSGRRSMIVLGDLLFDGVEDVAARAQVVAFFIGHELGRIVLGHASWQQEFLLGYLKRIPVLRLPLVTVQTYSRDRVAALLAPESMGGLAMLASGGEIFDWINVRAFLGDAVVPASAPLAAHLAALLRKQPHLAARVRELHRYGFLKMEPRTVSP